MFLCMHIKEIVSFSNKNNTTDDDNDHDYDDDMTLKGTNQDMCNLLTAPRTVSNTRAQVA